MNNTMWKMPPEGTRWAKPPKGYALSTRPASGKRRDTAWKLDTNTTPNSFIGRPLLPNDASRTKYDDNGPEDLLRLAEPSISHWSPLVKLFGLQVLDAAGFINTENIPATLESEGELFLEHPDHPIHPILRRDMWLNLEDEDWDLIKPSLQLATAILDTPEMLSFFAASIALFRTIYSETIGKDVDIIGLRKYMTLQFVSLENPARRTRRYGSTRKETGVGDEGMMLGPENTYTYSSTVRIETAFLDALRVQRESPPVATEIINMCQDGVGDDRKILIDPASSYLRTTFKLAEVILHEFTHAFCNAAYPRAYKEYSEPFFQGHRYNEVGHALEEFMFGGLVLGVQELNDTIEQSLQAPFGLTLWPDATWNREPGLATKQESYMSLPVHLAWVSALFRKSFWDERVARDGGRWIQTPRFHEWATLTKPV